MLADLPIAGIYVQALNLTPTRDSVEKLVRYVRFLESANTFNLPVITARVGAFGLVLHALGIGHFDSGLGEAEAYSLSSQLRPRQTAAQDEPATGGRDRRTYFPALKTTIPGRLAEQILADRRLHGITGPCTLECCRFRPATDLPARRRQHLLWSRQHELKSLSGSTPDVRLHQVHQVLLAARSTGDRLRHACIDAAIDPPKLEHLDCWLSVIARSREIQAAA